MTPVRMRASIAVLCCAVAACAGPGTDGAVPPEPGGTETVALTVAPTLSWRELRIDGTTDLPDGAVLSYRVTHAAANELPPSEWPATNASGAAVVPLSACTADRTRDLQFSGSGRQGMGKVRLVKVPCSIRGQRTAALGLAAGTAVGVSIIDAHAGGVGLLGASIDGLAPDAKALEQRLAQDSTHALYAVGGVDGQRAMQSESLPPGQVDEGDGEGAGDGGGLAP